MKIACTGHRPNKIGGYKIPNPTYDFIVESTKKIFDQLKPEYVIVGGALGFDQWTAEVCIQLGIPFHTYVPFIGQEKCGQKNHKIDTKI